MKKRIDRFFPFIAPLVFQGNILFNCFYMFLGGEADSLTRRVLVYSFLSIVIFLALICVRWQDKRLIALYGISVLFAIVAIYRLYFQYSWSMRRYLSHHVGDLFLAVLIFSIAAWMLTNNKFLEVLDKNRYYVRVKALLAFVYLLYQYTHIDVTTYFGWIDYMSMAYLFLFSLLADVVRVLIQKSDPRHEVVQSICWFVLVAGTCKTGCKGAIICIVWMCVCILFYTIIKRKWKMMLIVISYSVVTLSICAVIINSASEQSLQDDRTKVALNELTKGIESKEYANVFLSQLGLCFDDLIIPKFDSVSTIKEWATDVYEEGSYIQSVCALDGGPSDALLSFCCNPSMVEEYIMEGYLSRQQVLQIASDVYVLNYSSLGARYYLYGNAINDFLSDPLKGCGILSYEKRHGTYVHNIFLEVVADLGCLGIIIGVFSFVCLVYSIGNLQELKDRSFFGYALVLYAWFSFPRDMVSGTVYSYRNIFIYMLCDIVTVLLFVNRRRSCDVTF